MNVKSTLPLLLVLAACAPSPLHVGVARGPGTGGDVPRDGRGEPIWGAIKAAPPQPDGPGAPIAPAPQVGENR